MTRSRRHAAQTDSSREPAWPWLVALIVLLGFAYALGAFFARLGPH